MSIPSALNFYFNDTSLNPAEVYNLFVKLLLKIMKINKRGRDWSIQKLQVSGFEPRSSGTGSKKSDNCAVTNVMKDLRSS